MTAVKLHPKIKLLTYSDVVAVEGSVGNYKVKVRRRPRYIDESLCVGCMMCLEGCVFPKPKFDNPFDQGLGLRKPVWVPFPQAVPPIPVVDPAACLQLTRGKCKQTCVEVCGDRKAFDFTQQERIEEYNVGAIVLTTGFKAFDPSVIPYYGYGKYPNVYTSLEVERLVNAGGPTSGKFVLRDGSVPKRVGIVHCVGSRDANHHAYCSRVCCMYSLKLAHLVHEKTEAEVTNCYIDMRTPGKGFEEFYNRVQDEGVQFVRGKVADITPAAGQGTTAEGGLVMTVDDTLLGGIRKLNVDMVILAVALEAQPDAGDVRRTFGISCSTEGFFLERHPKLAPVNTANDGVFVAGACQGAKDIPDTVAQAAAAAAKALALIDAGQIELEPNTAWIDETMCSGCGTCITDVSLQGDHPRRRAEDRRDRRGVVQGLRHVRRRLPLGRRETKPIPRRTSPRRAGRADELCLSPPFPPREANSNRGSSPSSATGAVTRRPTWPAPRGSSTPRTCGSSA